MAGWEDGPTPIDEPTAAGSARTLLAAVGPLSYTPIEPYRNVATPALGINRLRSGYVTSGVAWRDQNGVQRIPADIKAVTFNLTVTQTLGAGFLALIPAEAPFAGVSTINWTTRDLDIANNGTVGTGVYRDGTPGCLSVLCGGADAATYFIIDITGYYL